MSGDALARLKAALADHGSTVRGTSAQCPAHDDRQASLSVSGRSDGNGVVLHCHAGCGTDQVLEALGMSAADLFDERPAPVRRSRRRVVAEYPYHDENGNVLYIKVRYEPKDFAWKTPDGRRGMGGATRRVLYRLPRVLAAVAAGEPVWICEGEKDVAALEAAGVTATCNFDGAAKPGAKPKWRREYGRILAGAELIIAADKDEAGYAHAAAIAGMTAAAKSVTIVQAAEGCNDPADHFAAGHRLEDFVPVPASIPSANGAHAHTPPAWAADQDILARLVCAMRVCGLVGETRNAKLTYLSVASQVLDDPVSVVVKGLSSAGKSFTVETVLRFVPAESVITLTAMSERALVYMDDDFSHKTIVVFEATALREEREKTDSNITAYLVRSLMSEGEIRYPVTVRDGDGRFTTQMIIKDGPTNFVLTTTATSLHAENETRMFSLPADDSREQTAAVLRALADGPPEDPPRLEEWHAFHRWLKSGRHEVIIPYAASLAARIPPVAVRLRRDFRAVLRLIETHALMHQLTRQVRGGAVVATEADYLAVRELTEDLICEAVGATVPDSVRQAVGAVEALSPQRPDGVTVHEVADRLGVERSRAQRYLKSARERGYLTNLEDKRGRPARYQAADPLPGRQVILPARVCGPQCAPPCTAYCEGTAGQEGVCACAPTAEGKERVLCEVCGQPLNRALAAIGDTTHPNCDPEGTT